MIRFEDIRMASQTQPATHPVLLAIAVAAFLVLFILGVNLHVTQSGHIAVEQSGAEAPKNTH